MLPEELGCVYGGTAYHLSNDDNLTPNTLKPLLNCRITSGCAGDPHRTHICRDEWCKLLSQNARIHKNSLQSSSLSWP